MTEPDPWADDAARTRNRVGENFGYSVQAGQAHGDVNVGTSRNTTISLPALSVIIGAVMTLVIVLVVWKLVAAGNSQEATSTNPPAGSTPGTASTSGTSSTRPSTPPVASLAKEVRLLRNTGVDVDGDDTAAKRVDGANGKTDLYLNGYNLLTANGSGISEDRGPEQEARERCTEAVGNGQNAAPHVIPAVEGMQYCFATSDGRVAWIRVKTTTLATFDSSASLVLAVRVW